MTQNKTKKYSILFLLIGFIWGFSQDNQRWKSYLSYKKTVDLTLSNKGLLIAAENAIYNYQNGIYQTKTSIDGLSGGDISTVYFSEKYNKTYIGYESGLIEIIDSKEIKSIIDIQNKTSINPTKKRINSFYENNDQLYIATDFGISVLDMQKSIFKDTYFIGANGSEQGVKQVAIYNQKLYAATLSEGIKSIAVDDVRIVDYTQWNTLIEGFLKGIQTFRNVLISFTSDNKILTYDGTSFGVIGDFPSAIVNSYTTPENLVVVTQQAVYLYNTEFKMVQQINTINQNVLTDAVLDNSHIYIGTETSGVLDYNLSTLSFIPITIKPDGPLQNNIFNIRSTKDKLWAVYGDYTTTYNPYPLDSFGISYFSKTTSQWNEVPYSNLLGVQSIVRATVDPADENRLFFSSYFSGLLEIKNEQVVKLYNSSNSGLESLDVGDTNYIDIRVNGTAFDSKGTLWLTNSLINNGLKSFSKEGEWKSYSLSSLIGDFFGNSFGSLIVDANDTKWIATNQNGLIAYNEKFSNPSKKISEGEFGNLPSKDVRSIAIDANNQLWIGTNKGLRILNNVNDFLKTGSLTTKNIVILDDGLAQELMFEQFISDIIVDGANRKWIATVGSGLFYISSNGQQTISHFTTANSPLPSNNINDIEINASTGELYIATDKGMVSFDTQTSDSSVNLNEVFIYPNPVKPGYTGNIHITGLIDKSNVKITDVSGNLVYQAQSEGGTLLWDSRIFGSQLVASGVYFVFITTEEGNTQTKKIMVVR